MSLLCDEGNKLMLPSSWQNDLVDKDIFCRSCRSLLSPLISSLSELIVNCCNFLLLTNLGDKAWNIPSKQPETLSRSCFCNAQIVAQCVLLVFGIFRLVRNLVNAGWPIAWLGAALFLPLYDPSAQYGATAVKPKREAASKSNRFIFRAGNSAQINRCRRNLICKS